MEIEADACIDESDCRSETQNSTCSSTTEESRDTGNCKDCAENHRRVHHAAAIAPPVVLVGDLEAAEYAGCRSEQRKRALKTPLAYTVLQRLKIINGMKNLRFDLGHSKPLNHLAQLIFSDGLDDLCSIFLSTQERLCKFVCLLRGDFARHRGLIRIDDCLD